MAVRISPRTGRMRKRPGRPRQSLTDRLANLHLLLQSPSFGRWPLQLTFFSEDVFRVWQTWTAQESAKLPPRVQVSLEEASRAATEGVEDGVRPGTGIYAIDVGYQGMRPHLEKSQALVGENYACAFCHQPLPSDGQAVLVCPADECQTVGHLTCFASSFLQQDSNHLIPVQGNCPGCGSSLPWIDLVKELSLRMRTPKVVGKILKTKKATNVKSLQGTTTAAEDEGDELDSDVAMDGAEWHYLSEDGSEEDMENGIPQSDPSPISKFQRLKSPAFLTVPDPTIEDSDWEEADIVT